MANKTLDYFIKRHIVNKCPILFIGHKGVDWKPLIRQLHKHLPMTHIFRNTLASKRQYMRKIWPKGQMYFGIEYQCRCGYWKAPGFICTCSIMARDRWAIRLTELKKHYKLVASVG